MSSRRKSKPVRRLDSSLNANPPNAVTAEDNYADAFVQEPVLNRQNAETENTKNLDHLPEGVYVVQPRSVSDEEDQNETCAKENGNFFVGNSAQKRANNHSPFDIKRGESLNLSVKRRKTEFGDTTLNSQDGGKHQTDVKKYLELMSRQCRLLEEETSKNHDVTQKSLSSSPWSLQKDDRGYPPALGVMMASLAADNDSDSASDTNQSKSSILPKQTASSKESSSDGQYSEPSKIDSITVGTVSSGFGKSIKKGTLDPTNFDEDVFDQYISRFTLTNPCKEKMCPYRHKEHYHCTDSDCDYQRFTNKHDVIRHYNMHKKRDNSLAHGFMRFSPSDDCVPQFGSCRLNGSSTHYHCLHANCTKTYTSTSDVMAHDNFHRKHVGVVNNGFRQYRATELCPGERCIFRDQRTTHFHCMRDDCNFSFKNKSDIDKHKAYHVRDDAYTRQGFKKFFKSEICSFPSCPWNQTANHFHCLRNKCNFSFISISQMVSHKRKHDRQEAAYTSGETIAIEYHDDKSNNITTARTTAYLPLADLENASLDAKITNLRAAIMASPSVSQPSSEQLRGEKVFSHTRPPPSYHSSSEPSSQRSSPYLNEKPERFNFTIKSTSTPNQANGFTLNTPSASKKDGGFVPADSVLNSDGKPSTDVSNFFRSFRPKECPISDCVFFDHFHFHCTVQDCCAVFLDKNLVAEHSSFHEKLEELGVKLPNSVYFPTSLNLNNLVRNVTSSASLPPGFIALSSKSTPAVFTETANENRTSSNHVFSNPKKTDVTRDSPLAFCQKYNPSILSNSSKKFIRKDFFGHTSETPVRAEPTQGGAISQQSKDSLIEKLLPLKSVKTSRKKIEVEVQAQEQLDDNNELTNDSYIHIKAGMKCIQSDCKYMMQSHWHCTLHRCRYVCKSLAKAKSHLQAHGTLEAYSRAAKDRFKSYSMKNNCPNPNCEFRHRGHYHCLEVGCQFVTIGTSKLPWHMKKHEKIAKREAGGFKYYTKKDRCPITSCRYSHVYSHYHCVRPGCSFAFQYKHQMLTHVRKHLRKLLGRSYSGVDTVVDFFDTKQGGHGLDDSSRSLLADSLNQNDSAELGYASDDLTPQQNLLLQRISKGFTPIDGKNNSSSCGQRTRSAGTPDGAFRPVCDKDDASSDNEALDTSLINADLSDSNSNQSHEPDCNATSRADLVNSSSNDETLNHDSASHLSDDQINAQVNFSFITQPLSAPTDPSTSSASPVDALSVSMVAPKTSDLSNEGSISSRLRIVQLPES